MTPINIHRQGRVEAIAFIDDADVPLVSRWSWSLNNDGYAQACGGKLMHRIVMGAQRGQLVDHIDHNVLMNVRGNLRFVTHSQNGMNQIRTGKILGLYHARDGKWEAHIRENGIRRHLGRFPKKHDAIRARLTAVRSYWSSQSLPIPTAIEQLYLNALAAA